VIAATTTLPAPTVTGGAQTTPAVIAVTTTLPQATPIGGATVNPATIAVAAALAAAYAYAASGADDPISVKLVLAHLGQLIGRIHSAETVPSHGATGPVRVHHVTLTRAHGGSQP
jgi:hypothetical protein